MDYLTLISIAVLLIFVGFLLWLFPVGMIIRGARVKLPLTPILLIGIRVRQQKPEEIIPPAIKLIEAGVEHDPYDKSSLLTRLEVHCLLGGNNHRVVAALIEAKKRQLPLTLDQAMSIDLSSNEE